MKRATPTSNLQPQLQDPTPQRDRYIMLMTRAYGRDARDRIGDGQSTDEEAQKTPQEL